MALPRVFCTTLISHNGHSLQWFPDQVRRETLHSNLVLSNLVEQDPFISRTFTNISQKNSIEHTWENTPDFLKICVYWHKILSCKYENSG